MLFNNKVSVHISTSTFGEERLHKLTRLIEVMDVSDIIAVSTTPIQSPPNLNPLIDTIRCADILVVHNSEIPVSEIALYSLERTLFPTSYSQYKRAIVCAPEDSPNFAINPLRVFKEPTVENLTHQYSSLEDLAHFIVQEANNIYSREQERLSEVRSFSIGVAISLVKCGSKVTKKSWNNKFFLKLVEQDSVGYVLIVPNEEDSFDEGYLWSPTPDELIAEDYITI